ncbi:riboflavin synthase [Kiloniella sp. b19]|uniref:riboflavin synthase n=1 Tax=Kiloniella sp. GXU_MW_B19 TaxID=3141326 RepID=UPI0031E23943
MFTGIITDLGAVKSREDRGDSRFVFQASYDMDTVDMGASIACSGVCLTVVDKGNSPEGNWFAADVSGETLSVTTLSGWQAGTAVNFERALRLGDELGGHLVSGHVDGVAEITDLRMEGDSRRFTFRAPDGFARFVAPKGSVVLDGVSLTVNEVEDRGAEGCFFGVNIIPHTAEMTTFGQRKPGDRINFEVDLMARYVAQLLDRNQGLNN